VRFFRKKTNPTDEQRKRLARITNSFQKKALLTAIERGEVIPEYAWSPFPEGIEKAPEMRALHKSLVEYAASSDRDLTEVIAAMAPETHIQHFADQARQTAGPGSGFLCETPLPARNLAEAAEKLIGIAAWGIFNPYGPTFSLLTLLPVPGSSEFEAERRAFPSIFASEEPHECLLHFSLLNPFHSEERIYGLVPGQYAKEYLGDILTELIRRYPTGDYALFPNCLPSFVMPMERMNDFDFFCQGLSHIGAAEVTKARGRIERRPNDPWGIADEQRDEGLASMVASLRDRKSGLTNSSAKAPDQPATPSELQAWLDLITTREHFRAYFGQMRHAWNGAIEHGPHAMATVDWQAVDALLKKILGSAEETRQDRADGPTKV